AVMPKPDEVDEVSLNKADLRIDTFRASGAGGQHVNKTDSAIRITHLPTGIVVECQDERSQHKNRARAMALLQARLQTAQQDAAAKEQSETRRSLVGSGDRSERIRTYNYPQGRVTDHRINLTLYKLDEILEGNLDDVIGPLSQEFQAEHLASLAARPPLDIAGGTGQGAASATIAGLLAAATLRLAATSNSPRLDAEVLLGHLMERSRTWLFTWPERRVEPAVAAAFAALVARRAAGEPVAHLTGVREFWSLPLEVTPATLIPRPDTELLVATALARVASPTARGRDLGTGTGASARALASERPGWTLLAVDREADAVALASRNRDRLGLDNVVVLQSDWFAALSGRFDLIVSNPPYIDRD